MSTHAQNTNGSYPGPTPFSAGPNTPWSPVNPVGTFGPQWGYGTTYPTNFPASFAAGFPGFSANYPANPMAWGFHPYANPAFFPTPAFGFFPAFNPHANAAFNPQFNPGYPTPTPWGFNTTPNFGVQTPWTGWNTPNHWPVNAQAPTIGFNYANPGWNTPNFAQFHGANHGPATPFNTGWNTTPWWNPVTSPVATRPAAPFPGYAAERTVVGQCCVTREAA